MHIGKEKTKLKSSQRPPSWCYFMKAYREMEVKLHTFLLSALDEKWSASRPDRFTASEPVKKWMKWVKKCKKLQSAVSLKYVSHPKFIARKLRNKNNKKKRLGSWMKGRKSCYLQFCPIPYIPEICAKKCYSSQHRPFATEARPKWRLVFLSIVRVLFWPWSAPLA